MLNFQKMSVSQIFQSFFSEYDLTNKFIIGIYCLQWHTEGAEGAIRPGRLSEEGGKRGKKKKKRIRKKGKRKKKGKRGKRKKRKKREKENMGGACNVMQ